MPDKLTTSERAAVLALAIQEPDKPTTILRRECESLVAKGLADHEPERWVGHCKMQWEYFELTPRGDIVAQILIERNRHRLGKLIDFYA